MKKRFKEFLPSLTESPVKEIVEKSKGTWKIIITSSPFDQVSASISVTTMCLIVCKATADLC